MNDVIVVGAGINGLTCAAYLAKAGQKVLVLEANPNVGGFVVTEDAPGAPGYRINPYAIEFPFADMNPSVAEELDLARFGLKFVPLDPNNTYVGPNGTQFSLYHSLDKTHESMSKISRNDADAWRRLMTSLFPILDVGLPYLSDHPTRPSAATLAEITKQAAKHRRGLLPGARILMQTPNEILKKFESDEIRTWIAANVVTGSFRDLDEVANTSILLYFAANHLYLIRRTVGGAGAFTTALVDCIKHYGGEVRTSAPVRRIHVENGRTTGVTLHSGERIDADQVVGAIDPTSLFTKLVDPGALSPELQEEVDDFLVLSSNVSHFMVGMAVSRLPTFPKNDIPPEEMGGLTFVPSEDYVARLMAAIKAGRIGDEIVFYIGVPSVVDRTLVPEGSEGHSLWVYIGAVPLKLTDGSDWQDVKQGYYERFVDLVEDYSPGFRDSILGARITSPDDMNIEWTHKGSSRAVDLIPSQIGPWRPSPGLAGYATPGIKGLWRTGHGTHPMSGTSGWPGRIAARTMLKQARGSRLPWRR
jgi:beta-carotene ketolase (CrtO type)